jgi:predicted aconitase
MDRHFDVLKLVLAGLAAVSLLALVACEGEAGEETEDAAEQVEENMEDAAEDAEDAAEDMADDVEDGIDDMTDDN